MTKLMKFGVTISQYQEALQQKEILVYVLCRAGVSSKDHSVLNHFRGQKHIIFDDEDLQRSPIKKK